MIDSKEKKEIIKRIHYVQGQLNGIEKMLQDDRPIKDVFGQLKAVESSIHQTIHVVLNERIQKRFAEILSEKLSNCPGDCENAERFQLLKQEFSNLDIKDLIDEINWLVNT